MRWLCAAMLLVVALGAGACGGDGKDTGGGADAPATPRPAADRPAVEDQLAIIDGSRAPELYREVLDRLAQKCREPRPEIANSIVEARQTLERERGVLVSVLDYLNGVDRVIPAGQSGVACRDVATELGESIGR